MKNFKSRYFIIIVLKVGQNEALASSKEISNPHTPLVGAKLV